MESLTNLSFTIREDLFTNQPQNAKCVEVGTRFGDLAYAVIEKRPDLKLSVVDSWEGAFADAEQSARRTLGNKVTVIKSRSVEASEHFDDASLDLVYIDAAHDYSNVTGDIKAWWPKVKKGGILSGHDMENKPDDGFWGPIEVERAVNDWAKSLGLVVNTVEVSCPSWWVVK